MERRTRTSPTSSPPFATQTIPATVHEAPCILEGLLMNEDRKSTRQQVASPTMSSPRARSWATRSPRASATCPAFEAAVRVRRLRCPGASAATGRRQCDRGLIDRNWTIILRGGGDHSRRDHAAEARLCKLAAYPRPSGAGCPGRGG